MTNRPTERLKQIPPWMGLLLLFVLSRLLFFAAGVRFNAEPLTFFWQYLDPPILQDHLLRGLINLHAQPPLFNLLLGVGVKLFPHNPAPYFHAVYLLAGWSIAWFLYRILLLHGFKPWLAVGLALLFLLTPEAILYENFLFYTWLVSALLLGASYAFLLFTREHKAQHAIWFLFAVTLLCLTRSTFHLLYLLIAIGFLFLAGEYSRRKLISFSSVAVALVGSLYLKNLLLFGFFGASSWLGLSWWNIAGMDLASVQPLVEQGRISEVAIVGATIGSFAPLNDFPKQYREVPARFQSIPELADEEKSNGSKNLNHVDYIRISKEFQQTAKYLILHAPGTYLLKVAKACVNYCKPSRDNGFLKGNQQEIQGYVDWTTMSPIRFWIENRLFRLPRLKDFPLSSMLVIPFAYILIFAGLWVRLKNRSDWISWIHSNLLFLFLLTTILYVASISNLFELGENNRMRYITDPLIYLCVLFAIRSLLPSTLHARFFTR